MDTRSHTAPEKAGARQATPSPSSTLDQSAEATLPVVRPGKSVPIIRRWPADLLALQHTLGNRAVGRLMASAPAIASHAIAPPPRPARPSTTAPALGAPVIQRRIPAFATVQPTLGLGTPASLHAEQKLKKLIRLTFVHQLDAPKKLVARNHFTGLHPAPANLWDTLLAAAPLSAAQLLQLADVVASIEHAQTAPGDPLLGVRYPPPGAVIGPPAPGSAQDVNLQALVAAAAATMNAIGAGNHNVAVQRVFGPNVVQANTVFRQAAAALLRLAGMPGGVGIVIDSRGDQAAVHAAGLTGINRMALSPEVVAAVSLVNQVTLIHESTHAIPHPTTDDTYTNHTPGSPFLIAAHNDKLTRAPFYEEVGAQVLGARAATTFVPGPGAAAPPGHAHDPNVRQAQADVEGRVTRAWTVAINTRDLLVTFARDQLPGGAYAGMSPAARQARDTHTLNISKVMGLTLHHRHVAGQPLMIEELDLAMAEMRATQLSKLIKKASLTNVADDRAQKQGGFLGMLGTPMYALTRGSYLQDKIFDALLLSFGHSRKDYVKEKAMLLTLEEGYDRGRGNAYADTIPGPLGDLY